MHHLGAHEPGTHEQATVATVADCCAHGASEEPGPGPMQQHDLLHLCLAILAAGVGLALALLAFFRGGFVVRLTSVAKRSARPRSPPPRPGGAPARLATLCVLRL
ncbi:hypothetical protein ADK67_18700 [Saccharothrix sp. NRRL B-16348]|nr:hypothetical protein ADK67_18700 [Saccharothrix sp. NRRL B-16348]